MIELLVVIAVIAILVSLLLPSLAHARKAAYRASELSAAQQLMLAITAYAGDNKSALLTGYPTRKQVNGPLVVLNEESNRIFNDEAQRYPWRLAPYLDFNFRGLYQDRRLLSAIRSGRQELAEQGVDFTYVVSLFPSLGMNIAFVGGSDRHQEFDKPFVGLYGRVYVARLDEPVRPCGLMAFISARVEEQPQCPWLGRPEGFFRVDPPRFTSAQGRLWSDAYDRAAAAPGNNSGFVSLRHNGKAVSAMLDGHARLVNWKEAGDMRLWSDRATGPDWGLKPR